MRHVFSIESNRALFATRSRSLAVYSSAVVLLAAAVLLSDSVHWLVFICLGVVAYLGSFFLGNYWANQDHARREETGVAED